MKEIEIYYGDNKDLLAMEFIYNDKGRRILNRKIKGSEVKIFLDKLSNTPIKGRKNIDNVFELIIYDDICIELYNYNKIKKDDVLHDYLEKIDEFESKKIATLSPKVKRENKYVGRKIIITGVLTAILLGSGYAIKRSKDTYNTDNDLEETYTYTTKPTADNIKVAFETQIPNINDTDLAKPINTVTPIITSTTTSENTTAPETTTMPETTSIKLNDNDEIIEIEEYDNKYIYLEYEDRSNSEKALKTKELYGETIEKYATMYGLDPKLVLALATQERGIHSPTMDAGGATGLMQIQNSIWVGNSVTAYNFETGKNESLHITLDILANCENNIQAGCMILQNCMKENEYNYLLSIQAYNMGTTGTRKAITTYSNVNGQSKEDIITNPYDCGWLEYRDGINGDPNYVEHVLSYMGNNIDTYIYTTDGKLITYSIRNYENIKSR